MPRHVVVDGSNLATEGRALPSLKQLNEAVLSYMDEHPDDIITVVVDATFGHRIDPREVPEFDAAVENNELVAPPAGAIGRGDAFVLTIANKVNATIISNDSYQEFHGDYDWLFDEGRLIGGKPVPNVGWVFVPRVPVRGPISRRAVKDSKRPSRSTTRDGKAREPGGRSRPSKAASLPMPVPAAPPPGLRNPPAGRGDVPVDLPAENGPPPEKPISATDAPTASRQHLVNDLLPFLTFVEEHPVGSAVRGVVESYSSHGAYVSLGDARGYVPLRLMAHPAPRSARTVMKLGDEVDLVVVSFNATRRSIDLSVPGMEPDEVRLVAEAAVDGVAAPAPAKRTRKKASPRRTASEAAAAGADAIASDAALDVPAGADLVAVSAPGGAPIEALAAQESAASVMGPPEVEPTASAPVKRSRKKAAAKAVSPEATAPNAPAPVAAGTPEALGAKPVKQTRKKAAAKRAAPKRAAAKVAAPAPPVEAPAAPTKRAPRKTAAKKAAAMDAASVTPPPPAGVAPVKRTRKKAAAPAG